MTLLTTVEATTSPARTSILPVQAGTTLFTGWDGIMSLRKKKQFLATVR